MSSVFTLRPVDRVRKGCPLACEARSASRLRPR
jgi:hypothetical protein